MKLLLVQMRNWQRNLNIFIDDENHNDKGPLAGIYTIMKQHPEEELFFVVSVDTPMITGKAVSTLYQF